MRSGLRSLPNDISFVLLLLPWQLLRLFHCCCLCYMIVAVDILHCNCCVASRAIAANIAAAAVVVAAAVPLLLLPLMFCTAIVVLLLW